jgi:hypothetical protein
MVVLGAGLDGVLLAISTRNTQEVKSIIKLLSKSALFVGNAKVGLPHYKSWRSFRVRFNNTRVCTTSFFGGEIVNGCQEASTKPEITWKGSIPLPFENGAFTSPGKLLGSLLGKKTISI